jgi:hypothetical protein
MIRDLTKSMLSFSWGMSLFGTKQLVNILMPEKATAAFNAVTQVTEEQLGDGLKGVFRAGDQLQKGMVDLSFSFLTLEALNPSQMMKMASDIMRQTAGAFGQGVQGGTTSGSQDKSTGWGPVPPPGTA